MPGVTAGISLYGPPRTISTVPYHQALKLHRQGTISEKRIDLKDKAVFVGLSEILLAERKDSFYTVFSQANGIFISGVEIAATAFANLLEERPLRPLPLHFFVLIILLWVSRGRSLSNAYFFLCQVSCTRAVYSISQRIT
jgi:adenylate cyclase